MWELLGLEIDVGTVPRPPVSRALSGIKVVRAYRSQAQARTARCTYTGKDMYQQQIVLNFLKIYRYPIHNSYSYLSIYVIISMYSV